MHGIVRKKRKESTDVEMSRNEIKRVGCGPGL